MSITTAETHNLSLSSPRYQCFNSCLIQRRERGRVQRTRPQRTNVKHTTGRPLSREGMEQRGDRPRGRGRSPQPRAAAVDSGQWAPVLGPAYRSPAFRTSFHGSDSLESEAETFDICSRGQARPPFRYWQSILKTDGRVGAPCRSDVPL